MNEFQPKLVLDSRINDISDKIDVAVESSAAQSTYQSFPAVNSSNNSMTFNVNIPSENIAVDRRVLLKSNVFFTVYIDDEVPVGSTAFKWGITDGLGQFPLNSLFSQVQATINNVSVSTPLEDIMAPLLRLSDQTEVSKMNKTTASYMDQNYSNIAEFQKTFSLANNPIAGLSSVDYDSVIQPNGVLYPYRINTYQYDSSGALVSNSPISLDVTNTFKIEVSITLVEPFLFLSPFSGLVKSKNEAAFLGINNMNIVANINSSNMWKFFKTTVSNPTRTSVVLGFDGGVGFGSPELLLNLMTLQPEQYNRINTRNVLHIQDYPRFVSSSSSPLVVGGTSTYNFPVIQLNQIPDTLLIFIRSPASEINLFATRNTKLTSYATINDVSISFNNQSGILASCSQEELYNLSQANGSKQSYGDFKGTATANITSVVKDSTGYFLGFEEVSTEYNTQGSILVVKQAYNFNLPSYLSAGSLGQFGLQVQLGATNNTGLTMGNPELVVIAVNSGLMVTQQGSSSLYSGLLTKNMVLETKQKQPVMDSSTYSSLTGGSVQESCNTGHFEKCSRNTSEVKGLE